MTGDRLAVGAGRGASAGQWTAWHERISAERPGDDPDRLEIWGYASQPSYAPGERVDLHVSTTAPVWGFEVWRDGARFERVHRAAGLGGAHHPTSPDAASEGCGWPAAASFEIPSDWPSGGYIVVFGAERDGAAVTQDGFFILRAADPGARSGLALVTATYTWQEYNDWGGGCGYFSDRLSDHSGDPAEVRELSFEPRLSFRRPWSRGLIRTPAGAPRLAQPPPAAGAAVGVPAADWAVANGYSVWSVAAGWARYDALAAELAGDQRL